MYAFLYLFTIFPPGNSHIGTFLASCACARLYKPVPGLLKPATLTSFPRAAECTPPSPLLPRSPPSTATAAARCPAASPRRACPPLAGCRRRRRRRPPPSPPPRCRATPTPTAGATRPCRPPRRTPTGCYRCLPSKSRAGERDREARVVRVAKGAKSIAWNLTGLHYTC